MPQYREYCLDECAGTDWGQQEVYSNHHLDDSFIVERMVEANEEASEMGVLGLCKVTKEPGRLILRCAYGDRLFCLMLVYSLATPEGEISDADLDKYVPDDIRPDDDDPGDNTTC